MLAGGAETVRLDGRRRAWATLLLVECAGRRTKRSGLTQRLGDEKTEGWEMGAAWRRHPVCWVGKGVGIRLVRVCWLASRERPSG